MAVFNTVLNLTCLIFQGIMHVIFVNRITAKKPKAHQAAIYGLLLCALEWISGRIALPWIAAIGIELLVLYGVSRFLSGNRRMVSLAAAVLAVYISQLSFGLVNSAEALLFPYVIGVPLLYVLLAVATAVSFGICAVCCASVVRFAVLDENAEKAGCFLFPTLFFFTAELYILQTSYTQASGPFDAVSLEEVGRHTALLVLQALGLGALLCTLYAYRRLCRSYQEQAELQSLFQAVQTQKTYIAEAQLREERTRAFRHDLANHLSVLNGLLSCGKLKEGQAYLQRLKAASGALAVPYRTGDLAVDILLGEKLGLAEDIAVEVSVRLPSLCGMDSFDLCVIFANALDNAIHACQSIDGPKRIRVHGEQQGDFYLLAFENTCAGEPLPPPGTGLSNIRAVAEKYHGSMLTEKKGGSFSLNVLLNTSRHPEDISIQKTCFSISGR